MDNAVEASAGIENAVINLSAELRQGMLIIRQDNPANAASQPKERRVPELERGLGLHILENISRKYGGQLQYGTENGRFSLSLILNTEGKAQC